MDELDQLVTTKQDVVYNFFNWPNLVGSKLIVLAVANTHDLPERTLSAKVRSRLGVLFGNDGRTNLALSQGWSASTLLLIPRHNLLRLSTHDSSVLSKERSM